MEAKNPLSSHQADGRKTPSKEVTSAGRATAAPVTPGRAPAAPMTNPPAPAAPGNKRRHHRGKGSKRAGKQVKEREAKKLAKQIIASCRRAETLEEALGLAPPPAPAPVRSPAPGAYDPTELPELMEDWYLKAKSSREKDECPVEPAAEPSRRKESPKAPLDRPLLESEKEMAYHRRYMRGEAGVEEMLEHLQHHLTLLKLHPESIPKLSSEKKEKKEKREKKPRAAKPKYERLKGPFKEEKPTEATYHEKREAALKIIKGETVEVKFNSLKKYIESFDSTRVKSTHMRSETSEVVAFSYFNKF